MKMRISPVLLSTILLVCGLLSAAGETWSQSYDPAVPTPESVLGHPLGGRATDYAGMERYLEALAESSPRVVFDSYGSDYESRTLRYAVVSEASNLRQLEAIKATTARLTDPRTLEQSQARDLIQDTPIVVWFNHSADGNETAGLESALQLAYHLAASTEEATRELLQNALVVITPIVNPASHERWVAWSNSFAAGPAGNDDPLAMEHHPPWGVLTNYNHYLVDLNRESVWATQRESAALQQLFYEWNPAVFVDLHGEYDNFTGPGYTEPLNPLYPESVRRWFDRFGRAIARKFAASAWSYSPWETGSFYPGYWESFATLNGAVGFTFETTGGGSNGLRIRRPDGSVMTLKQGAEQHFQASLAVLETAVANRKELLADYAAFWRSALEVAAQAPEKGFLIEPGTDSARADQMAAALLANRIEVFRTTTDVRVRRARDYFGDHRQERSFAPGTYVIPVTQPRSRLLLSLMKKQLRLPQVTLEEAETFRSNREKAGFYNPNIARTTYLFYDVTAWSMPLTYGVPTYWSEDAVDGNWERIAAIQKLATPSLESAGRYGYVFSGATDASQALVIDLLQQGLVMNVAYDGFVMDGRAYPRGSVLIRNQRNAQADLFAVLREASRRHGVAVHPIDTPHSDSGPSMGSDRFVFLKKPRVAVLVGDPVSERSFGDLWFLLEQRLHLPFTAVYPQQLSSDGLDHYDVIVLPHGRYKKTSFSEQWLADLKSWVSRGGTLVCLKGAAAWAADPDLELTAARTRPERWPIQTEADAQTRSTMGIPGAILRTLPDEHHYLTMGYAGPIPVLVFSNLAFEPDPQLAAPVTFGGGEGLLLSGFAYPDSLARLAGTPYLLEQRVGSGHVVLFLDEPQFRVYWYGLTRLLLNSVLLSPSF